ncbi:MAG: DUF234 domain-containing protein [Pleomorphochaeta sp.]
MIIKKEIPATESKKSRKGIYVINDNFLNFYFHFIKPYESQIDRGLYSQVYNHFNEIFYYQFQGRAFEKICRQLFISEIKNNKIDWAPFTLGSYFNRNHSIEIDIVSIDNETNKLFLGECKFFKTKLVDINIYNKLVEKSKIFTEYEKVYGLFSVTGFSDEVLNLAKYNKNILLFNEYRIINR